MKIMSRQVILSVLGVGGTVMLVLVCACAGPDPAPEPAPEPTTFNLKVLPGAIDDTIPGQDCVLLVTIEEDNPTSTAGPVTVAATAEGATAVVEQGTIAGGQMAEVTVTMLPPQDGGMDQTGGQEGWACCATIRATRGDIVREIDVPITLTSTEEDLLAPEAAVMRDRFIPWLAENRPELGIDETTAWNGTIVKPHWLVVSHYLFLSDEWEMHVSWHVMIAPYDWARIELRRRFEETLPSLAFEIPSVSAPAPVTVNEIEPEGLLWR
jgi:hypothetical protein